MSIACVVLSDMLRIIKPLGGLPQTTPGLLRSLATKRGGDADEPELAAARQWLSRLDAETIPRNICDISFSRSSGPGGQNVNK